MKITLDKLSSISIIGIILAVTSAVLFSVFSIASEWTIIAAFIVFLIIVFFITDLVAIGIVTLLIVTGILYAITSNIMYSSFTGIVVAIALMLLIVLSFSE